MCSLPVAFSCEQVTYDTNLENHMLTQRGLRATFALVFGIALLLPGCGKQADAPAQSASTEAKEKVAADAKALEAAIKEKEAQEAAIYAYPLVTMEITRRVITNVETPAGSKAPMGQLARLRNYPAVDDHSVTAPNADTLYTTGWIDVSKEPWVFSIPDMKDRYFLFPMLDGWTNVFQVPGKRTTGT